MSRFPDRVSYAATFSVGAFNDRGWRDGALRRLASSFGKGAVAVKIWKNVGMGLTDADGKFVMIDDDRFDPIIDFVAQRHVPIVGHLGEPRNCWLPLSAMNVKSDREYYEEH